MFKLLVIVMMIGVCTVSCNVSNNDESGFKHVEHSFEPESNSLEDNHHGHAENHDNLGNHHHYEGEEDEEDDHYYNLDGFQANDPLNNYSREAHHQEAKDKSVEIPQINHDQFDYQRQPPPAYDSLPKLPTIDENHVLADDVPVQLPSHDQPLRERILASTSRRYSNARPKLESLRVDLKNHTINLRNNPKVVRGIDAVSRTKASFKGKLYSMKSRHEMRKAERLQHQQQPIVETDMNAHAVPHDLNNINDPMQMPAKMGPI